MAQPLPGGQVERSRSRSVARSRRERDGEQLRAALPPVEPFAAWAAAGAQLPPDFARLPARAGLWSPVEGVAGAGQWPARRALVRARWRRWLTGPLPAAPARTRVRVTAAGCADGVEVRELVIGTGWSLRARLLLPEGAAAGAAAVPVYLLQSEHARWAQAALARGWGACLVSAGDSDDDTAGIEAAHPGVVAGRLGWRAWALSRVMDALEHQPGVDAARVLVGGHSRNGKTALLAAAFDDRFAGVVSSSSGVLGAIPARLCTDRHFGEGVELLTRHYPGWYHPRLRWFAGREHRLPTDAHELLALVAPRPVLVSVAVNDPVERVPAARAAVDAAREAYALLGAPGALALALRPGGHSADEAAVAAQLDWAQAVLGDAGAPARRLARTVRRAEGVLPAPRSGGPTSLRWPGDLVRPGPRPVRGAALATAVRAALGPVPAAVLPGARAVVPAPRAPDPVDTGAVTGANTGDGALRVRTAGGLDVSVLRGRGPGGPRGLVLWLGPPCAATGWRAGYEQAQPLPEQLAADGWDVACHDPVASGPRHAEALPRGRSPLGRMTADAADAARAAMAATGADAVWLAAYGTGALVALHLVAPGAPGAAGGLPVAGAALAAPTCGEPLLRARPAYTLADLLAALADRTGGRAVVLDPAWDPEAPPGAVAAACRASGVARVPLQDWHRLSAGTRERVVAWFAAQASEQPLPQAPRTGR